MTETLLPPKTHNLPPIEAPDETAFFNDLKSRHADVDKKLKEFEDALAGYPKKLTLADEDTAANLQDLLKQMSDYSAVLAKRKKEEKKPWDKLVKIVQSFFAKAEDKIGDKDSGWLGEWRVVHQQFLDLKAADNQRKQQALLEQQKLETERLEREAQEAAKRKAEAEAQAEAARKAEEEARERQRLAEEEERIANERRAAAADEEKRLAEERKVKEKAERETNVKTLATMRLIMRQARRLNDLAEAEEADDEEIKQLGELIMPGGLAGKAMFLLSASKLLDEEQEQALFTARGEIETMRNQAAARVGKREQKRLAKLAAEEAAKTEAARKQREAEQAKIDEQERIAREAREKAEADAAAAKETKRAAVEDVREAREEVREASSEAKQAGREQRDLETDADRAGNRVTRIERRIDRTTDADLSRTYGDLGTTGSITRNWISEIVDEDALRAVCGPLGEHFATSDLEVASRKFMRAHQSGFNSERVDDLLPGVVFMRERDSRIA